MQSELLGIINSYPQDDLSQNDFTQILNQVSLQLQLPTISSQQIAQIFQGFQQNNLITKFICESIIINILQQQQQQQQQQEEQEQEEQEQQEQQWIYLDIEDGNLIPECQKGNRKGLIQLDKKVLSNLSLENLSELKQVYYQCEEKSVQSLQALMRRMALRIDIEIGTAMYLFQAIANDQGIVPGTLFSQLLAHLENTIFDTYYQLSEQKSIISEQDYSEQMADSSGNDTDSQQSSNNIYDIVQDLKLQYLDQLRDMTTPKEVRQLCLQKIEKQLDRLVSIKDQDRQSLIELQQQDTFSLSRIQNLEQEVAKLVRMIDDLQVQNDQVQQNNQILEHKNTKLQQKVNGLNKQASSEIFQQRQSEQIALDNKRLKEQIPQLNKELTQQREQLATYEEQIIQMQRTIDQQKDSNQNIQIINKENPELIETKETINNKEHEELQEKYQATAHQALQLIEEVKGLQQGRQSYEGVISSLQQEIDSLQTQIRELHQEYKEFQDEKNHNSFSSKNENRLDNVLQTSSVVQQPLEFHNIFSSQRKVYSRLNSVRQVLNDKILNEMSECNSINSNDCRQSAVYVSDAHFSQEPIVVDRKSDISIQKQNTTLVLEYLYQPVENKNYNQVQQILIMKAIENKELKMANNQEKLKEIKLALVQENEEKIEHIQESEEQSLVIKKIEQQQLKMVMLKKVLKHNQWKEGMNYQEVDEQLEEVEVNDITEEEYTLHVEKIKLKQIQSRGPLSTIPEDSLELSSKIQNSNQIQTLDQQPSMEENKINSIKHIQINHQEMNVHQLQPKSVLLNVQQIQQSVKTRNESHQKEDNKNIVMLEQSVKQQSIGTSQMKRNALKTQLNNNQGQPQTLSQFSRDYLNLLSLDSMYNLLKYYNELKDYFISNNQHQFFSDTIFRISSKNVQKKRILFINYNSLYIFYSRTDYKDDFKVSRRILLRDIKELVLAQNSAVLIKIKATKGMDIVLNTFKRSELTLFLMETFKIYKYPFFKRTVADVILSKKVDAKTIKTAVQVKKEELKYHKELIDGYQNSLKNGFMTNFKKNFLSSNYTRYYYVLTNIGLLQLKKPDDDLPKKIIPIIGSILVPKITKSYKNSNFCFRLITKSEKQYLFICETQREYEEWVKMIQELQLEAQTRKLKMQEQLLKQ